MANRTSNCSAVKRIKIAAGLVYCMEYLERNMDWLVEQLARYRGSYVLFDCPGQAELYTHHTGFFTIARMLQKLDFRVSAPKLH